MKLLLALFVLLAFFYEGLQMAYNCGELEGQRTQFSEWEVLHLRGPEREYVATHITHEPYPFCAELI